MWYGKKMEKFSLNQQAGFNNRAQSSGLVNTIMSFELFVGKKAGARINEEDLVYFNKYPEEEIRADVAEVKDFFKKYFQGDNAEFRPSMLAEELVKIGGRFDLFGEGSTVDQASSYDDYKNNADDVAQVPVLPRDKKDERLLRPMQRFVIDVTTDKVERMGEKINKLSAELRNGKLSNVKYFPSLPKGKGLQDIPRFIVGIDEEELFAFFEKAKPALDRSVGVDEKRFKELYAEFSRGVCEKIVTSARTQVELLAEYARTMKMQNENVDRILELLSSPLGGLYQTLEYVSALNVEALGIEDANNKKNVSTYIEMIKKVLSAGVAVERSLEDKIKKTSTQIMSEALH